MENDSRDEPGKEASCNPILPLLILVLVPHIVAAQCPYPDGIGSGAGDKPFLSFASSDGSEQLILCGANEGPIGNVVLRFGALETCRIETIQHALHITKLAWLPYGHGWQWVHVPYERSKIWYDEATRQRLKTSFVFMPPAISAAQVQGVLEQYQQQRQSGKLTDDLIFKLLAVALYGNQQAEHGLLTMRQQLTLDSHLAARHKQAMAIYHQYHARP